MSKCDTCVREKCFHRSHTVVGCSQYAPKQKTNADRIRAMTDEEMASDLLDMFEEICEDGVPSTEWMLHWLKQPAEGECV